ncbi:hypothetical protein ACFXTO_018978 [Malus domestica]
MKGFVGLVEHPSRLRIVAPRFSLANYGRGINQGDYSSWHLILINGLLFPNEHATILDTPIGDPTRCDRFVWAADQRGKYSVKSGYM